MPGQLIQQNRGPGQEADRQDFLSGSFSGEQVSQVLWSPSTEVLMAQRLTGIRRVPHGEMVGQRRYLTPVLLAASKQGAGASPETTEISRFKQHHLCCGGGGETQLG